MSGDYLFPKRKFKEGEPLDKAEINDALQVSAERLNGHLNPHNIRAPLAQSVASAAEAFFRTEVAVVDVDPLMQHAPSSTPGKSPQPGAEDAFLLEQETGWVPVTGSEDMIVEMTTGSSALIITAQAAHCYAGKYDGDFGEYRANVPVFSGGRGDEIRNDSLLDKNVPAPITVEVTFGSTVVSRPFFVDDARNFSDLSFQSEQIARKIAREPAFNANFIVTANGRTLSFRSKSVGPVAGPTRTIRIASTLFAGADKTVNFSEVSAGSLATSGESLDSLHSCDPTTNPTVVLYYPAQIQYALRVDGVVITESITGRFDNEQAPLSPVRVLSPKDKTTNLGSDSTLGITGPMTGRFRERPDAVNIPMFCVRLTASVNVEPGDHVVELVVRRVPTGRRRSFTPPPPEVGNPSSGTTYLPRASRVLIYSRQLSVTDAPTEPMVSAVFGDPSVVASFSDEDVISNESLVVDKLQPVADSTNDVDSFQVARGAINGDHLGSFSSVLAVASSENISTPTIDSALNPYDYPPDFSAHSFSASLDLFKESAVNYALLDAAVLQNPEGVAVSLEGSAANPLECVLTIEANVFLRRLVHTSLSQSEMHLAGAVFIIGLFDTTLGEYCFYRPSIAWVNSNNYIAYQRDKTNTELFPSSGSAPTNKIGLNYQSRYGLGGANTVTSGDLPGDFVDVPVTAHINFSGVDGAGNSRALIKTVDKVAIFGSAVWMGNSSSSFDTKFVPSSVTINAVAMKS
jgi:hypothetical protein